MPATAKKTDGAPIWIELASSDPARAAAFYTALLAAKIGEPQPEFGDYRTVDHWNGGAIAGLMPAADGAPSAWVVYLLASDLDDGVKAVEDSGGTIVFPPHEAGDLGRFAFFTDTSGASAALWEPWAHPGIAVENEAGAPTWYELHTTSHFAETVHFYQEGLDWVTTVVGDTDAFRMVTYGSGPSALAGISDASATAPDGTKSAWMVYFAVADADAAADIVRDEGGTVLDGPMDSPYGRMCHAIDPTGAPFAFIELPDGPASPH